MLQFFSSIADFLNSAWEMITNIFSSLVTAIVTLTTASSLPVELLPFVPGFLGACIISVYAVGIVKLIVGWGNQ